jgi:hypothetical protein
VAWPVENPVHAPLGEKANNLASFSRYLSAVTRNILLDLKHSKDCRRVELE